VENLELIRALRFGGALDAVWLPITNLGSEFAYIALLTAIYLVAPKVGRQLGFWFGVSVTINTALKLILKLPRPYDLDATLTTEAARETLGSPGLPSGHAQNAATTWGFLAFKTARAWFNALAVILIALIAFSRLSLGVHFLEDVLAGLAIGGVIAFAASRLEIPQFPLWASVTMLALGLLYSWLLVDDAYGRSLAVMIGFAVTTAAFKPPSSPLGKIMFVLGGLILAVGLYILSSLYLPDDIKRTGWGSFLRYAALLLIIAEGYPRALSHWLPKKHSSS
jgi:membrane-associated phospholipid phosphatase